VADAHLEFASYAQASAFVDALNAEARAGGKLPPGMRHASGKLPLGGLARWAGMLHRCSTGRLHAYGARARNEGERTVLLVRRTPSAQPSHKPLTIIGGVVWLLVFLAVFYVPLLGDLLRRPSLANVVVFLFLSFMMLMAVLGLVTAPRFFAHLCEASHGIQELHARHRQFLSESRTQALRER
jgi:hypothetical protein